jgi:AcrR family transcriptional regulator
MHSPVCPADPFATEVGDRSVELARPRAAADFTSSLDDEHSLSCPAQPPRGGQTSQARTNHCDIDTQNGIVCSHKTNVSDRRLNRQEAAMTRRTGNRQRLLDAAVRCIEERGYARTTARDLVQASGTNLGAISYHFESKEALLNEALGECCRRWLQRIQEASTAASSGNAWVDAITVAYAALRDGREFAVAYAEAWVQAERSPALRAQLAAQYREFRTATAILAQSLTPSSSALQTDPEALGTILVAIGDGLIIQWLLDADSLPEPARLARALTEFGVT